MVRFGDGVGLMAFEGGREQCRNSTGHIAVVIKDAKNAVSGLGGRLQDFDLGDVGLATIVARVVSSRWLMIDAKIERDADDHILKLATIDIMQCILEVMALTEWRCHDAIGDRGNPQRPAVHCPGVAVDTAINAGLNVFDFDYLVAESES